MRNISFKLTTRQFLDGTKTVTRRLGWWKAKHGDQLMGVEQAQGIKAGELNRLGAIELIDPCREPLSRMIKEPDYGELECIREGFPGMKPAQFVEMFCDHMKCLKDDEVNRMEFRHLDLHQGKPECPRCKSVRDLETIGYPKTASVHLFCPVCRAVIDSETQVVLEVCA